MQEIKEQNLELKFDPKTIKHLGVQMYQTLPPVLAELISNSYDANATWVRITFNDNEGKKQIIVEDNGDGMSFDEIKEDFLVIGKNRRENEKNNTHNQRKVTGRKGLGKLAVFGVANQMHVQTVKGGLINIFCMDLNHILCSTQETYQPEIIAKNEPVENKSGTQIILNDIKRKTPFNLPEIRENLAKRFAFTDDFNISLEEDCSEPLSIDSETKWEYIVPQYEWNFPDAEDEFAINNNITGKIITTEKPLKEDQRGVFLYARGKLVNRNEFYGLKATTSLAYNYMTGVFYIDYIDDLEEDYVSTNRDGLTWNQEDLQALQDWLKEKIKIAEKRWRAERTIKKDEEVQKITGVNLKEWTSTMPAKYQKSITSIVSTVIDKDEMDNKITSDLVNELYKIVPQYPIYHWRELHPEIQNVSKEYYKRADYYNAFSEAMKRYKNAVKEKSKVSESLEMPIMTSSFGKENKPLSVTAKYKKRPNGYEFEQTTLDNIEEGQKFLSMGVVAGGRNVINHEVHKDLRETGLFSEKNCLDLLSLLSHLYYRLDDT